MRKIGILGGTFDPPHYGHLLIAEEVRLALELDEVWFIPTYQPPHKENTRSSVGDRIAMLNIATEPYEDFKVNLIEIEREGKSYTYDTMRELTERFPNDQFYFIIGADMVETLSSWYKIDSLLELVTFVVTNRHGYNLSTSYPVLKVEIPMFDVSSTLIRKRIKQRQTVRFLLPDSVYAYIKEKRLYE